MSRANPRPLLTSEDTATVAAIAEELRSRAAVMTRGSRLPSVRNLMRRFGVGQLAVQQAMAELETDGLIVRKVGKGTFVARDGHAAVRTVTVLHSDYPSRRGQEISSHLNRTLREDKHQSFIITYPSMEAAIDLLRAAPPSDAYVLQPMDPQLPLRLLEFLKRLTPAVVVDGQVAGIDVDSVDTDWRLGLETAVMHLRSLGHTRIGMASGEPLEMWQALIDHFDRIGRWSGEADGFGPVLTSATRPGQSSAAGMREALEPWLREHREALPCTALIVNSYASAIGAFEALHDAGVSVPGDLSLVVLDNPDLGAVSMVPMTMVGHTSEQIAARLVATIERRWNQPDAPFRCLMEAPELVSRQSSAPRQDTA